MKTQGSCFNCVVIKHCASWTLSSNTQICISSPRPVTSFAHQEGRSVFWEGPKIFELWPIFSNYIQHIFPGGANFFLGGAKPSTDPWLRARVHLVQRFVPALSLEVYCLPTHTAYMAVTRSTQIQGHNEVRWRPRQETSLAPSCSNLRSFESKCTVLKKVLVTLLGLFSAPRSDSTPGELCSSSRCAPAQIHERTFVLSFVAVICSQETSSFVVYTNWSRIKT